MRKSIFKYPDTNSARANIEYLTRKFKGQKIAIIGLGGTGSYILDHVAKTSVEEIHLFDADDFEVHNAFRAPGAIDADHFAEGLLKVNYLAEIYSRMHNGIVAHAVFITKENISQLKDFSYVFIAVDKGEVRSYIIDELLQMGVTFIDCGIGIHLVNDELYGAVRTTTGSSSKTDHLPLRIGSEDMDLNEYGNNIQISDLNCLNAVFAVMKWKKLCGFYQDIKKEHHSVYFLSTNKLQNDDFEA